VIMTMMEMMTTMMMMMPDKGTNDNDVHNDSDK
jgi:hypothetical protein